MEAKAKAIPSPYKGWNTKDSLADMGEQYAILLDNWFPSEGRVEIRPGYTEYATGLGGNVETLAEYEYSTARVFLAAANGSFFNVSAAGAVGAALATGFSVNRWQYANMDGKIGFVNGTDAPQQYDGTTFGAMTISGTALTVANLIGVNIFGSRSYFWEENSQDVWYSATNALGGALTKFPLSRVGQFGGKLLAMGTWTRDAGDGMDDLAVFLMTSGEVIVYSGQDPASFSLVGVFRIGAPLAIRGMIKLGADLLIITKDGYVPLKGVIDKGRVGDSGVLSDKINTEVSKAAQAYGSNFGWQAFHYPNGNMLIFNIPVSTNTTYQQHVFNTLTGAPCRFKNINARVWGLYNDNAYFGGSGSIYQFNDGYDDNGAVIDADGITSSTYLGPRSQLKMVTAIQPIIASDGKVQTAIMTESDYKIPGVAFKSGTYSGGVSDWDAASWDTATWSSGNYISKDWISTGQYGYNFITRIRIRSAFQKVKWYSINYLFNPAGLV
jgi:hypothetical protein